MGLKNSLILMLILNSISLVCQEKPNILWLVCEDQSLFFAPYGDSNAYTPNINQLANEGTVYENCFTVSDSSPKCLNSFTTCIDRPLTCIVFMIAYLFLKA